MHALTTLSNEESVDLISVVTLAGGACDFGKLVTNVDLFIEGEQVGNLTGVEQVVNIFEEGFVNDLSVTEEELDGFLFETALA
jgi:hypothetical protein